jgi:hypothetical protein
MLLIRPDASEKVCNRELEEMAGDLDGQTRPKNNVLAVCQSASTVSSTSSPGKDSRF